jgi:nitrile hydratase
MDGVHDLGGMHGFGAVLVPGADAPYHQPWEPRVFALAMLVALEGLGAPPGGRATREEMDPVHYLQASYYERWLWSTERQLERRGTIAPGEVERMLERLAGGAPPPRRQDPALTARTLATLRQVHPMRPAATPRFRLGARVRVRRSHPAGHTRCPRYARGAVGTVAALRGADRLPDLAAYGRPAPLEPVYTVAFDSEALWGPDQPEPAWTVRLDLWERYLEPAEAAG